MTPTPIPTSEVLNAISSIAGAASSLASIVALPSWAKIIAFGVSAIGGSIALYFLGKYLVGWWNEATAVQRAADATQGRATADESDQNLNAQTGKLPKD